MTRNLQPYDLMDDEHYTDYHMKSHGLIYAASDLTARMMDVMALMLTEMQESDWEDENTLYAPEYKFTNKQLVEWFGADTKQLYSMLKQPCKELAEKSIGIDSDDGFRFIPMLADISYLRGILTIQPNIVLRDKYLINASQNGHAKIDNKIFKSLGNPNTKRTFEFICRYRYDSSMYFMFIRKLQILFSVLTEKGKVLKPAYAQPSAFIKRVIEPSLKQIAESPEAQEKLEIQTSKDGQVGYELVESDGGQKIRFLVKWKNEIPAEKRQELYSRLTSATEDYNNVVRVNAPKIQVRARLATLENLLRRLDYEEQANAAKAKLDRIDAEILKEQAIEAESAVNKEQRHFEALLDAGVLDSLFDDTDR